MTVVGFSFSGPNRSRMSRPLSGLRIGLDLDNTLISYDQLFHRVAIERGLIPRGFSGAKRTFAITFVCFPMVK